MSTVTVPIIYSGIIPVTQQNFTFVVDLPYDLAGLSYTNLPYVDTNNLPNPKIIAELNAQGGQTVYPSQANLQINGVIQYTVSDGSTYFEITLNVMGLQASTTAIYFSMNLLLEVAGPSGGTLDMTYGIVANPPMTQNYQLPIWTTPPSSLSSISLVEISSNTNYPAPGGSLTTVGPPPPPMSPMPSATPAFDTTVTIPVTVPPPTPPNQVYLGVVFVVQMVFGAIRLESTPA